MSVFRTSIYTTYYRFYIVYTQYFSCSCYRCRFVVLYFGGFCLDWCFFNSVGDKWKFTILVCPKIMQINQDTKYNVALAAVYDLKIQRQTNRFLRVYNFPFWKFWAEKIAILVQSLNFWGMENLHSSFIYYFVNFCSKTYVIS